MDGGAWEAAVHGVAERQRRLSDFTFTSHFHALKKEMATHSRVLTWRIPGMGEPGGLPVYGVAQSWTRLKRLSSSSSIHRSPNLTHLVTNSLYPLANISFSPHTSQTLVTTILLPVLMSLIKSHFKFLYLLD